MKIPANQADSINQNNNSGANDNFPHPLEPDFNEPMNRVFNEPLVRQKLFMPHLRSGIVPRLRLLKRLDQSLQCAVTLISAPAGYGKTTLLSEWLEDCKKSKDRLVCWLSLDSGDNDPIRFLTYLTAALESARPQIGKQGRPILQSYQLVQPNTYLSILINEVQELSQQVILVLDDYQTINNPGIHEGIVFILEHLPGNFHLFISTRSDPPFPLALLRGRNQLNELRMKDLRFTSEEVSAFLLEIFNLPLSADQISLLENRTEGWIAGLQMAALSITGREDISEYLEDFSGTHRFIIDYLTEEALNRQPTEVQNFLLRTSILERMNRALCNYILDDEMSLGNPEGTAMHFGDSQALLNKLERSNLFMIALDDERNWYRYHHLFAELLSSRLEHTSPELIPILHKRASAWFANNGWIDESISHALAAKDWNQASRLINLSFRKYLENGQMATVLQWIKEIPQEVIFEYPKLCAQVAEVYSQAGMIGQIDPFLDRAEMLLSFSQDPSFTTSEVTEILSMAAILRGLKAICAGDPHQAMQYTESALSRFPAMEPRELAVLYWVRGWAYRSLGDVSQALETLTQATEYAQKSGAILRDVWTDLGNVTRIVGKLPEAITIINTSIQNAMDRGIQNQGNLSRDETFLSFIFLEQNDLDQAFTLASQALEHTRWWPSHIIIAMANLSLAQIHLSKGNLGESLLAIQNAEMKRKNWLMTPFVQSLAEVTWARIWLVQNHWDKLDQWSKEQSQILETVLDECKPIDEYLEMRLIMLVRVWLEKAKTDRNPDYFDDSLNLLNRLEKNSQTMGRINSLVEVLWLKEVARFLQTNQAGLMTDLAACLEMAERGRYMRIFLDTGEPARFVIKAYLQKTNPAHKAYALKILKSFGNFIQTDSHLNDLPEAITPREMDVLRLLADGYSNQQMADKLVVSVGTIKFHVHQLLSKLQVKSRTQAIVRAKDLELL